MESPYIRGRQLGALHFSPKLTTLPVCKNKVSRAVRKVLGGYTMGHLGLWRQVNTRATDPCYIYEIAVNCDKHRKFVIEMYVKEQVIQYTIRQEVKYELLQAVIYEWKGNRK